MKKIIPLFLFMIIAAAAKAQTSFTEERSSAWINVTAAPVTDPVHREVKKTSPKKKTLVARKKTAPVVKENKATAPKKDVFQKTNEKVGRFKKG